MADFRHETERLVLRDWRDEDWEPFWRHLNTPNVMRHLGGLASEEVRRHAEERLLGYKRDHGHTFWVTQRKDDGGHLAGEIIGFCGLKRCNEENGPLGDMEAGWRLREDAWGHGYAKEAAKASIDLAFTQFDAPHVIALTVEENAPSWGLMRRLGMERRADMDFPDHESWAAGQNIIVYLISRERWAARRDG
ncbi:GNAT family N-acetyltransferase [Parerythrobacter jejuensis]|uniref:GNAT family N-acetyltransferase n=1 Tax=Parerythrobacter jejuensis TaxID=795812 RepID=A0A845AN82_9SPHN|nr:GNAT family N-acetyltransferase [Parerythrobacter jejuensis]MXP30919.1 GNAT family N-acetyltransferase [Parerythrobacter jejuensis]MXP33679.1 GNAT family N-acetyltransferase [Parerythrobacter jejuensis]